MDFFGDNTLLIYLIAGGFSVLLGLVIFGGVLSWRKNSTEAAYERQLAELLSDDDEGVTSEKATKARFGLIYRWNHHWGRIFKEMGYARYTDDDAKAGREVALMAAGLALVLSLLTMNIFIGPLIAAGGLVAASMVFINLASKKAEKINEQLPGFLFALKANIQANEIPERAILKVTENMPSPLYDDLLIVRNHIRTNSSFKEALEDLSLKTSSRDLKFLCACMIQAASTGSTYLEPQITTIQRVLADRKRISDEINKATREASTSIWITSIAIPATFAAIYFIDANSRNFWFQEPLSWAGLAVIAALWGFGVFMSKKLVDNIRNI